MHLFTTKRRTDPARTGSLQLWEARRAESKKRFGESDANVNVGGDTKQHITNTCYISAGSSQEAGGSRSDTIG